MFAKTAESYGHRLVVYSPQYAALAAFARVQCQSLEALARVRSRSLLERLRDEADCLLITQSHDPREQTVLSTLFPSKVADYSAMALPIVLLARSGFARTRL